LQIYQKLHVPTPLIYFQIKNTQATSLVPLTFSSVLFSTDSNNVGAKKYESQLYKHLEKIKRDILTLLFGSAATTPAAVVAEFLLG
jgi:hypothetical protein